MDYPARLGIAAKAPAPAARSWRTSAGASPARLQGLAEPDAVVISAGTRRLVGDLFEVRDLGAVGGERYRRAGAGLAGIAAECRRESAIAGAETSHIATLQACAASWRTSSRPIPEPPPVTTAILPAKSFMSRLPWVSSPILNGGVPGAGASPPPASNQRLRLPIR
jgi:hypothetical protein